MKIKLAFLLITGWLIYLYITWYSLKSIMMFSANTIETFRHTVFLVISIFSMQMITDAIRSKVL